MEPPSEEAQRGRDVVLINREDVLAFGSASVCGRVGRLTFILLFAQSEVFNSKSL